jgi:hypothetical protein
MRGCQIFLDSAYQNIPNIPKQGKMYPKAIKYPRQPQNIPIGRKVDQMAIKQTNIFHCKTLQKFTQIEISFENLAILLIRLSRNAGRLCMRQGDQMTL